MDLCLGFVHKVWWLKYQILLVLFLCDMWQQKLVNKTIWSFYKPYMMQTNIVGKNEKLSNAFVSDTVSFDYTGMGHTIWETERQPFSFSKTSNHCTVTLPQSEKNWFKSFVLIILFICLFFYLFSIIPLFFSVFSLSVMVLNNPCERIDAK